MLRTRLQLFAAVMTTVTVLVTAPAAAQTPWPRVGFQRGVTLDPGLTPTATLAHLLHGVPTLSDAQRDTVEVLEQELRDTVAVYGSRIARARQLTTPWWSEHNVLHEREKNVILARRQQAIDRMRDVLTPEQAKRYDVNAHRYRFFDIWFWDAFASGGVLLADFDPMWEFP